MVVAVRYQRHMHLDCQLKGKTYDRELLKIIDAIDATPYWSYNYSLGL